MDKNTTQKRLHLVSLGCPKNLVDSEVMLAKLELDGFLVVDDPAKADLLLVNTCGFIQSAVEEAIDEILRLAEYKRDDPDKMLVVAGCLVQRYAEQLTTELPEVDLFTGTDGFQDIDTLIRQASGKGPAMLDLRPERYLMTCDSPRRLSTPPFRSYLKITEGCDNRCSYCMIPSIRGRLRSRTIDDLVAEAEKLSDLGVKELTLIAQDLTAYGRDLPAANTLPRLLEELLARTDIPWLRLLYLYPSGITAELLALMASEQRITPYLDIPLQHVSDRILRLMNRPYGRATVDDLLTEIRQAVPDCAIRTTLMVGFPGETEQDVEEMIAFLKYWQLDHVGLFQYEDEEGSPASRLPDKIRRRDRQQRFDRVMQVQAQISLTRQQRFVDRTEPVLIEGLSRESDLLLEGRTRYQAPDIDGCVYITAGTANAGDIALVRVNEAHAYDLVGELVDNLGETKSTTGKD